MTLRTYTAGTLVAILMGCAPKPKEATGSTPRPIPPRPAEEWTLEEVRDSVLTMVQGAVAPGDTSVHIRVGPATFRYWYVPDSATGYAVQAFVTRDSASCLLGEMERALAHRGWSTHYGYSADGPDGSVMGYVTSRHLCVVEGSWDGGDNSDPTYVPAIGCEMTVTCVPRRMGDEPQ